jgi:very-short-patch-repair endonuclease
VDYRLAFENLVALTAKQDLVTRRRELLQRLDSGAPTWATCIRERVAPHDTSTLPGNVDAAWTWRYLHDELDHRASQSLDQLYKERDELNRALHETTAELIECKAWASQKRRTTLPQRVSLIGWQQVMRKIGAGYGKGVAVLRAEARKLMEASRSAVPVWIMPLSRICETFDPAKAQFDVLIIDEASQADAMALIPFYMAKSVVVVGDHEQVSPDAVGQKLDIVRRLIDEHLQDVPNAILYDGQQSIYDIALRSFGGHICLTEHFRCAADIIQFSNRLSYDYKIKPLRDTSALQTRPHVVAYRVQGATSVNKVNLVEAKVVASLLLAAAEQQEYAESTFGIISLLGEEQAWQIDTLLRRHMEPNDYSRRRIMCGIPPQFQGDERDVMFLSVVSASTGVPLRLMGYGPHEMYKKRFNVAASRARNQMWVVHSLQPYIDLQPNDLRRQLIEHAQNPAALMARLEEAEQHVESEFERLVVRRLVAKGYQVKSQWKVGRYRIDLVVEDGHKRLAVECDGDRYHPLEKLPDDMVRQAILERLGWTFVRIRGSLFFRDPDCAMETIFSKLESMEIYPVVNDESADSISNTSDLVEHVIHRAEAIRRECDGNLPNATTTVESDNARSVDVFDDVGLPESVIVNVVANQELQESLSLFE